MSSSAGRTSENCTSIAQKKACGTYIFQCIILVSTIQMSTKFDFRKEGSCDWLTRWEVSSKSTFGQLCGIVHTSLLSHHLCTEVNDINTEDED